MELNRNECQELLGIIKNITNNVYCHSNNVHFKN
uniref:Uncharacterized protein n=1 Tax=Anguilla anguilla TaxID=7936 RepID=A0A0E9UDB9_ANGAN